jgi:hypothetical protein
MVIFFTPVVCRNGNAELLGLASILFFQHPGTFTPFMRIGLDQVRVPGAPNVCVSREGECDGRIAR